MLHLSPAFVDDKHIKIAVLFAFLLAYKSLIFDMFDFSVEAFTSHL
jgi:hypothetical protein